MPQIVIDIPVDLGTTVYEVYDKCHPMYLQCPFEGGYGCYRCGLGNERYTKCKAYYVPTEFRLGMENDVGKSIFLTEQDAKNWVDNKNKSMV